MRLPVLRKNIGRGRRTASKRSLPRWARIALVLCVVGISALVVRGVIRHDAFVTWRRGLETQGEKVEWPPFNPAWPKFPQLTQGRRATPINVAGPAAFAARNAEVMRHIPCYCGACPPDHDSNLSCYVTGFRQDGAPIWTDHAAACPICINITREVMLMTSKGWSLEQIRETLDREYERAGYRLSTTTPHPTSSSAK